MRKKSKVSVLRITETRISDQNIFVIAARLVMPNVFIHLRTDFFDPSDVMKTAVDSAVGRLQGIVPEQIEIIGEIGLTGIVRIEPVRRCKIGDDDIAFQ